MGASPEDSQWCRLWISGWAQSPAATPLRGVARGGGPVCQQGALSHRSTWKWRLPTHVLEQQPDVEGTWRRTIGSEEGLSSVAVGKWRHCASLHRGERRYSGWPRKQGHAVLELP